MRTLAPVRFALCTSVATALLAACGALRQAQDDTQPPIGTQGAMPTLSSFTQTGRGHRGQSGTAHYLYVTNQFDDNVSAYTIDPNGALTPAEGSPFKAGSGATGVSIDPIGRFAYVTNGGSDNVSVYAIDAGSGALAQVKGSPFKAGVGPNGAAIW
jgi:hypothetical protein